MSSELDNPTNNGDANDGGVPRKRVSQSRRNAVTDQLAAAYADGQITTDEFDERTKSAWNAVYEDELTVLTADLAPIDDGLPQVRPGHSPSTRPTASPANKFVTGQPGGVGSSIAFMGGVVRTGDWTIAQNHSSVAFMGGTDINLLKAHLSSANTRINATAFMGGIEIIVPEDVRVKCEGGAFMGGFGVKDHRSVTISQSELPADAPTITITGFAFMGGVDIIRAARSARV